MYATAPLLGHGTSSKRCQTVKCGGRFLGPTAGTYSKKASLLLSSGRPPKALWYPAHASMYSHGRAARTSFTQSECVVDRCRAFFRTFCCSVQQVARRRPTKERHLCQGKYPAEGLSRVSRMRCIKFLPQPPSFAVWTKMQRVHAAHGMSVFHLLVFPSLPRRCTCILLVLARGPRSYIKKKKPLGSGDAYSRMY